MSTIKLFREDVYMKEADATVMSVSAFKDKTAVTLDRTVFFPEGGGQSCDLGTLGGFQVLDVYEKDDRIIHITDCLPDALSEGMSVHLAIDWSRRFDNMQRHCGEHILTGMFYREYGGVNRGFHMGEQYMTIDISLEKNPEYKTVTWEMAKHAELCANEAIWQNAPVITRHFDNREDAAKLPLRKELAIEHDITIVCVGSVDNPSDCVACCGTHPSSAGQVGMIKIFKVESNKGMFRIYFEAGRRAFLKYQHEMDVLSELSSSMSAGTDDVLSKYAIQQEKNRAARTQLHLLKKDVIAKEAEAIIRASEAGTETVFRYELLTIDDLSAMARELTPALKKIVFLVHEPSNTVLLVTGGKEDCGRLVKENASIYNGKGGGNKNVARAIFSKKEYADTFIDLIEKHLR